MEDVETGGEGFEDVEDVMEQFEEAQEDTAAEAAAEAEGQTRATKFLSTHHPECHVDYIEDVEKKLPVTHYPPVEGKDPSHRSVPYLTQFERTKILGFRANQLAQGNRPLVQVPSHITDVMDIARMELEQKRLPFLLKRPMPDGTYEYWRLADLILL